MDTVIEIKKMKEKQQLQPQQQMQLQPKAQLQQKLKPEPQPEPELNPEPGLKEEEKCYSQPRRVKVKVQVLPLKECIGKKKPEQAPSDSKLYTSKYRNIMQ
jgi:hypothetical protein